MSDSLALSPHDCKVAAIALSLMSSHINTGVEGSNRSPLFYTSPLYQEREISLQNPLVDFALHLVGQNRILCVSETRDWAHLL